MTKRKMVLVLVLCFSIGALTRMTLFQACGLASDSGRSGQMSERQRKREAERSLRQRELERRKERAERRRQHAQTMREAEEQGRGPANVEQHRKAVIESHKEFLREKYLLGVTQGQWELIKPKLEEVRRLRSLPAWYVHPSVVGGQGDGAKRPTPPHFKLEIPWKDTPADEITEAQRVAQQIAGLVGKAGTTPEVLRLKIAALRKARSQEAGTERELAEARRELRELVTTRQEAVLVLLQWL